MGIGIGVPAPVTVPNNSAATAAPVAMGQNFAGNVATPGRGPILFLLSLEDVLEHRGDHGDLHVESVGGLSVYPADRAWRLHRRYRDTDRIYDRGLDNDASHLAESAEFRRDHDTLRCSGSGRWPECFGSGQRALLRASGGPGQLRLGHESDQHREYQPLVSGLRPFRRRQDDHNDVHRQGVRRATLNPASWSKSKQFPTSSIRRRSIRVTTSSDFQGMVSPTLTLPGCPGAVQTASDHGPTGSPANKWKGNAKDARVDVGLPNSNRTIRSLSFKRICSETYLGKH